jgi:DNA repair protein SbcC/Rad50
MRPHQLRVTAFGAFGGTAGVCFDDLAAAGLFLLHGETGAGKTTLLDAIGFALYGRVPGERGKARRLRSDHAEPGTPTEVQLEATIGGRRMRITRKPEQERQKLRGTGTTTEQAKVLLEESRGGSWHAVSTRAGEADEEIRTLMGMSADQFFQVVLLPQGEFATFLHADAGDRAKLLQRLFGTDRFHAVEEWLARRRKATADEARNAEGDIAGLLARVAQAAGAAVPDDVQPGDPQLAAAWSAELTAAAAAAELAGAAEVLTHRTALDQALDRQRAAERRTDRQRRRADALAAKQQLAQDAARIETARAELGAALRAAEVSPALEEADRTTRALADAQAAQTRARNAVAAVPGVSAQAAAAQLRAGAREHLTTSGRLEGLRSLAEQAAAENQTAAAARLAGAELAAAIDVAQAEAAAQRGQRPALSVARDQARTAGERLPGVQAEAERHHRGAADMTALALARADVVAQSEAYIGAKIEHAELLTEAARLRMARIDGMRAELAAALVDGAPCPVCGSLDHPELCELTGERVTREQEEAADAEAAAAAERAESTGARLGAADERAGALSARLAEAGFTPPADQPSLQAEAGRLTATWQELKAEADKLAAAGLADLQDALDDLDQSIADADKALAGLADQHQSELRQAAEADQRAAKLRQALAAELGGAPDLDTALSAERAAAAALTAAADAADVADRAAADASRAAGLAVRAAAEAGFGHPDEARQAVRAVDVRRSADRDIREHEARTRAVTELLADPDLDIALEPPADVAAAAAGVEAAQQAHAEAVAAHDRARHQADQLAELAPQLSSRLDGLAPLTAQAAEARQLADLAAGQGANTLRMTLSAFVLAARLEEVAAAATERLLKMTSGRYSLVHTDARRGAGRSGLGLLACDSWTGVDRDTSTLSGGETFLASLALALGLADVVSAEAGGTRIEALFVDEGFGSLDEETLEEVMTVLDGLREGGRIVGIVSHVAELRQRIPAQVRVHKGHSGSHLAVRATAC